MKFILRLYKFAKALPYSIVFNLRYLPFREGIKFPVLINKAHFKALKGHVRLEAPRIKYGMIKLGYNNSAIYPANGITWKCNGTIVFKGNCNIGNDCYVVCEKQSTLVFGAGFRATAGIKIISMCGISFGDNCLIGWGTSIIDSSFHPLYDIEKKKFRQGFGKIVFGDNNWLAAQCFVLPGTQTPNNVTFAARSVVGGQNFEPCCVYGGSPLRVLLRNVMRDPLNDVITNYSTKI